LTFWHTRPAASDGERPLPATGHAYAYTSRGDRCPCLQLGSQLPPAQLCQDIDPGGLVLMVAASRIYVSGEPIPTNTTLESALEAQVAFWSKLGSQNVRRAPPFVFAPAETSFSEIAVVLRALREVLGADMIWAAVRGSATTSIATKSLGNIDRSSVCCAVAVHVGSVMTLTSDTNATWGGVLEASQRLRPATGDVLLPAPR
ncbi:MAG TPA: hypothetical protein VIV60_15530, partial [Polyangiaceae bacterium]